MSDITYILHRVRQGDALAAAELLPLVYEELRKLAAARTFLRYLRREGMIEGDPGALVATPKRDVRMPAHLSEAEMTALVTAPAVGDPLGRRDRAILEQEMLVVGPNAAEFVKRHRIVALADEDVGGAVRIA